MRIRTGLVTSFAMAVLASSSVMVVAQDEGPSESMDAAPLVAPGPLGKSYAAWISEAWLMFASAAPVGSVEERCSLGDQGDVFFVFFDTIEELEDLSACTIREDQHILGVTGLRDCSLEVDAFEAAQAGWNPPNNPNKRQERRWEERANWVVNAFTCQHETPMRTRDVVLTVDGASSQLDPFLTTGTPFEFERPGDPPAHTVLPTGYVWMIEPLPAGQHRIGLTGASVDGDGIGNEFDVAVDIEIVPATGG